MTTKPWRVGRRVSIHLYDADDKPVGTMLTAELAAEVVGAVNGRPELAPASEELVGRVALAAELAARDEELRLYREFYQNSRCNDLEGLEASEALIRAHRAKASPPPGEQAVDDAILNRTTSTGVRIRDLPSPAGEGPPRVGDVVRVVEIDPRDDEPMHAVGGEYVVCQWMSHKRQEYPLLVTDVGELSTWCKVEVVRRAQPSPVASETSSLPVPINDHKANLRGGHGPHHGEIAELTRKVDEMYHWFVNRCESENP